MNKKLYRSREQKMLAGVCGGIAEYFNIDVTVVRLVWALLSLPTFGTALFVYIIAAIIIPDRPFSGEVDPSFVSTHTPVDRSKLMPILGIVLVVVGIMALIGGLFPFVWRLVRNGFWPAIIIIVGVALIFSSRRINGNN